MQFSDEELIAFILQDASAELTSRIRNQLGADPNLSERLVQLRILLGHIDSLGGIYEPPADLVSSTMDRIEAEEELPNRPVQSASSSGLSAVQAAGRPHRSFLDSTALALCLAILCCLALPMMVSARFEARKAQCAQNLWVTGQGLIDYALSRPDQRFPRIASEGPEAFAGMFVVRLNEAGMLQSPQQLRCASLGNASERTFLIDDLPTIDELRHMPDYELRRCQASLGGDFSYNLGVQENGYLRAPRLQGRSHFAILADAPVLLEDVEEFIAHDGRGINIFFEDGRVSFTCTSDIMPHALPVAVGSRVISDHPFRNSRGQHQFGLHPQDACLAPSQFNPLGR